MSVQLSLLITNTRDPDTSSACLSWGQSVCSTETVPFLAPPQDTRAEQFYNHRKWSFTLNREASEDQRHSTSRRRGGSVDRGLIVACTTHHHSFVNCMWWYRPLIPTQWQEDQDHVILSYTASIRLAGATQDLVSNEQAYPYKY